PPRLPPVQERSYSPAGASPRLPVRAVRDQAAILDRPADDLFGRLEDRDPLPRGHADDRVRGGVDMLDQFAVDHCRGVIEAGKLNHVFFLKTSDFWPIRLSCPSNRVCVSRTCARCPCSTPSRMTPATTSPAG